MAGCLLLLGMGYAGTRWPSAEIPRLPADVTVLLVEETGTHYVDRPGDYPAPEPLVAFAEEVRRLRVAAAPARSGESGAYDDILVIYRVFDHDWLLVERLQWLSQRDQAAINVPWSGKSRPGSVPRVRRFVQPVLQLESARESEDLLLHVNGATVTLAPGGEWARAWTADRPEPLLPAANTADRERLQLALAEGVPVSVFRVVHMGRWRAVLADDPR